jgi:hypothetical protein
MMITALPEISAAADAALALAEVEKRQLREALSREQRNHALTRGTLARTVAHAQMLEAQLDEAVRQNFELRRHLPHVGGKP